MTTEEKFCEHCGVLMQRPAKEAVSRWDKRRYCGKACYGAAMTASRVHGPRLDTEELRRFSEKYVPEPNSGCWLWTGGVRDGYGVMSLRGRHENAHRVAYRHFVGPISEGMVVDHLCRVRCCVNPAHLEPVTQQKNVRRGETGLNLMEQAEAIRTASHCQNGHEYTPDNTYFRKSGTRRCKTCTLEANRRSAERRAA